MKQYLILISLITYFGFTYSQSGNATYKKLEKALNLIENQYVDTVNSELLVTEAVKAMVQKLDPHTKYFTEEENKKNTESLNGSFGGIGINYQILYDTLMVLSVVNGGPAMQAGIQPGDKIIYINEDTAFGKHVSHSFFTKRLRGDVNTKVNLTVKRKQNIDLLKVEINRGEIPIRTLDASFMLDRETGYIKINSFSFTTMREFELQAGLLQMQGMKNLILDLRGNPGGLMIASINLADEFLNPGELIVYTQGEHYKREEYKSTERGSLDQTRLLVLVDELSASASEIFAGAMQDLDRGLIVGRRTYGKGMVGRNFNLPDGSSIRLTTGFYYTPSGRCIQKPYKNGRESYRNDLTNRKLHGELFSSDSIKFSDSLLFYTKNQRRIYGGGGIMPDLFIPFDTTKPFPYFDTLSSRGIINAFAGAYLDRYLTELQANYKDVKSYKKSFHPAEREWIFLMEFTKNYYKYEPALKIKQEDKERILQEFKSYLGRSLFENGAYYYINWQMDNTIVKSLDLITSKKEFKKRGIQE